MTKTQICAVVSGISSIAIAGIVGIVVVGFKANNKNVTVSK